MTKQSPLKTSESPERLVPIYQTPTAGHELELLTEDASLEQQKEGVEGTKKVAGRVRVVQRWSPMMLTWDLDGKDLNGIEFGPARLKSANLACDVRVWSTSPFRVGGYIDGSVAVGTPSKVSTITFHLPNYPAPAGVHVEKGSETSGATTSWSRIVLEAAEWQVVLEPHRDSFTLRQMAREGRSVTISGIGQIRRSDGAAFKPKIGLKVAEALRFFLSFAFAEWCPPLLLVGTNASGKRVWEHWSNYEVEPQTEPRGWLDVMHGASLTEAFPGFWALWQDEDWEIPFSQSVTWLIEASRRAGGTEGAIAFGQIPLEMLAWLVFVDKSAIVEMGDFDKLSAASKLQMLLSYCGIPLAVPAELPSLAKIAKASNNMSGPKAATSVRNTIIHPNKKNRDRLPEWERLYSVSKAEVLWETHRLFQWYITLVLLRSMNYTGRYAKRLAPKKVGDVEPVPWALPAGD